MPRLAPGYTISRVIKGGWQLASGHGADVDRRGAIDDMARFADAGITTFDCADIYPGVEELIGEFLEGRRRTASSTGASFTPIQVHTKFVPDRGVLATMTRADAERHIDRSLRRLHVERLYSLLDRRPEHQMVAWCRDRGVALLCYGSLAGGFLSDRWLKAAEPREPLENRSLTKYKLIIDEVGGWPTCQRLLAALQQIAARHSTTIGAVAIRYVLDRPQVGAVIGGARHGRHLAGTLAAFELALDADDRAAIDGALAQTGCPRG